MRTDPQTLFRLSMLYRDALASWPLERVFRVHMDELSENHGYWVFKDPDSLRRIVVEPGFLWLGPKLIFATEMDRTFDRVENVYQLVHTMRLPRDQEQAIQIRINQAMDTMVEDSRKSLERRIDEFLGGSL